MLQTIVVSVVVFNQNMNIALGKRCKSDDKFPGLWGIPGGEVEVEPLTPHILEKNIEREVREELGIEIKIVRYLTSNYNKDGTKLYIIFIGQHSKGDLKPTEETVEVGWFSADECKKMSLTPFTYDNILEAYLNYNP